MGALGRGSHPARVAHRHQSEPTLRARRAEPLTPREREVAALIAQGLSNRQVAEALVITELTAETHVRNILGKLGVRSRARAAVWAAEQGLLARGPG